MSTIKVFVTLSILPLVLSSNVNITSPPVTNWGIWGRMDRCPPKTFANGFQLRTQSNQFAGDDTALNTIRLFCGDPSVSSTHVITSTPGEFGDWGNVYTCFPGVLNGFQLSLPSTWEYIQGDGHTWGDWTQAQRCKANQGICGIQTQVDPYKADDGDDTMLNNVRMECCDLEEDKPTD